MSDCTLDVSRTFNPLILPITNAFCVLEERLTPGHVEEFFYLWYHGSQIHSLVAGGNQMFQCILPFVYLVKSNIAEAVVCQCHLEKWEKDT